MPASSHIMKDDYGIEFSVFQHPDNILNQPQTNIYYNTIQNRYSNPTRNQNPTIRIISHEDETIEEIDTNQEPKYSLFSKVYYNIKYIISNMTVEPLIACCSVCDRIKQIAIQNLNLEKACLINLNYGSDVCSAIMRGENLTLYHEEQKNGQTLVAELQIWSNFFLYFFPSILLLFIGSYSDKYNLRKPFLMLPWIGYILMCIGLILSSYYFTEFPLYYNGIIESIVPGLFGYWVVLYMSIFSYISAITSLEERTFRIGLVSISNTLFNLFGSAISGIIVRKCGYITTFSILLAIYTFCLLYTWIRIEEVKQPITEEFANGGSAALGELLKNENKKNGFRIINFCKDFFNLAHIKDTFILLFKNTNTNKYTDPKKHVKIILIMACVVFLYGSSGGEFTVMYLYTRFIFHWNEYDYSTFYTIYCFTDFFGCTFCVSFFSKFLEMSDPLIGLIAVVSTLVGAVVYVCASTSFIFCFGALASLFANAAFVAMRAIISKLTSAEELGKVMSAFMLFESLAPMVCNPIYNAVYRASIDVMPSSFLLLSLILNVPAMLIFAWTYFHDKKVIAMRKKLEAEQ